MVDGPALSCSIPLKSKRQVSVSAPLKHYLNPLIETQRWHEQSFTRVIFKDMRRLYSERASFLPNTYRVSGYWNGSPSHDLCPLHCHLDLSDTQQTFRDHQEHSYQQVQIFGFFISGSSYPNFCLNFVPLAKGIVVLLPPPRRYFNVASGSRVYFSPFAAELIEVLIWQGKDYTMKMEILTVGECRSQYLFPPSSRAVLQAQLPSPVRGSLQLRIVHAECVDRRFAAGVHGVSTNTTAE